MILHDILSLTVNSNAFTDFMPSIGIDSQNIFLIELKSNAKAVFDKHEQVKKLALLPEEWTIENGGLRPRSSPGAKRLLKSIKNLLMNYIRKKECISFS